MSHPAVRVLAVTDECRPWHDVDCPARDAAERRIRATCTCPPERWLDAFARPIAEVGDSPN